MAQRILQSPDLMGIAQVMCAALLWGTVGVAAQSLPETGRPAEEVLGILRLAIGGPALIVLLLLCGRGRSMVTGSIDPLFLALFSVGCATFQICLFRSFESLGITVTVFLTVCLPPVMSTTLSLLRQEQAVTRGMCAALGLASLGLSVFAIKGAVSDGAQIPIEGLGLAVLGSAAFVVMTVAARRLTLQANPLAVAGIGLTVSACILGVASFMAEPRMLLPSTWPDIRTVLVVLYLGLGPTALAYLLYCRGVARCRSTNLGLVASMVEPAFAMGLAWLVLAERLSFGGFVGCGLVLAAMVTLWCSEQVRVSGQTGRMVRAVRP